MRALSVLSALFLFLIAICQPAVAQEKNKIKFGKVGPDDFKSSYTLDSNAAATTYTIHQHTVRARRMAALLSRRGGE